MQNPFQNPGFSMASLTAAINLIPNRYGRLEELNLFPAKPVRTRSVVMVSHFFAHGRMLQRFGFDVQPVSAWDRARFALAHDRLSIEHWILTGEERRIRAEDLRRASITAMQLTAVSPRLREYGRELALHSGKTSAP